MTLQQARELSESLLQSWGFLADECVLITNNLLAAELVEKRSHGLSRLNYIHDRVDGAINMTGLNSLKTLSDTAVSLHFDGELRLGIGLEYLSLNRAIEKARESKLLAVGIQNVGLTGYIGDFARMAAEKNLIYIGFHNSTGGLIPHGSLTDMLGTNPITIGIPSNDFPVILDMASSNITWGDVIEAHTQHVSLPEHTALDKSGHETTDPQMVIDDMAGLLPFAEHKGSGLGFVVELLGGALTGSRVGYDVEGGWGSFYILIDPTLFRPIDAFKKDVSSLIHEVKNSKKMPGFDEILIAGERSHRLREQHLQAGEIEVSDALITSLRQLE